MLDMIKSSVDSGRLESIAAQFKIDPSSMNSILDQVVPALGKGVRSNTLASGGLESLSSALSKGNHQRYLGDLASVISREGVNDGNSILGHILGSKDASRTVATKAAESSGVSPDVVKQMLPMIATMFMGTLSKQSDGGAKLARDNESGLGDMLSSMLDSDGDGSAVDDVLDLAKKFF